MAVYMRGPLRLAVTTAPGMPSSWKDCTGLLTSEAIQIFFDSVRRSSVTTLTDSLTVDAKSPTLIPIQDLESLEDIPISIATRGRHALCLKCQNSDGAYEKHVSFSSESQFASWRSSLAAAIESRSHATADFDYFASPPVDIALPPPPQYPFISDRTDQSDDISPVDDANLSKFSYVASCASVENLDESTQNPLYQSSSPNQTQPFHSRSNTNSNGPLEHVDSLDDYPTIMPLMNALLSADESNFPSTSRSNPATVAVNLLRLNARAVAAASVETKFETDTLVSSLKQSINHLQISKDELLQEFESLKEVSKQSAYSQQELLEKKDEEMSILSSKLRQIHRACGLETNDATKVIEFIASLQEKFLLQSTATYMLQSEIEFMRQSGTRAATVHASIVETKDSEISNLACALQTKISENENLMACLESQVEKANNYELANSRLREDTIRHQAEADARVSTYQHNTETKIRNLCSERDALEIANGNLVHDLQTKCSEVDNLLSSLQIQSDNLHSKNSEIESLVSQMHQHAETVKNFELSIAHISEEAVRNQKESEMRMFVYQHNSETKIQVLSSERDSLQSNALSDAETLKRFRDKYVTALADNSLLLETIRILNNSVAQLKVQICELESKLDAKDLEISSGKSCLQELIRETDSNRQLLHSAIDRHSHAVSSRSLEIDQV
jgi:hypothetical protein